ncbi:AimR family lysis-lysogeny pheromone receptor, partial [Bacillus safensis]|uniref:AimR family lysis-lysogeny pheromone receptor n=1 Tax=Bacillus safensis TaxID=561879 RepID=UPI002FFF3701
LDCFDDMFLDFEFVAEKLGIHVNQLYNLKRTGKVGFRTLLKMSQLISGENYHKHMRDWCTKLTTTESIKHAFEYAAIKRDTELLKELLKMHRTDQSLLYYTQFYQVIYNYMTNAVNPDDLKSCIDILKFGKDKELKILKAIFKCYSLYYERKFMTILEVAPEIERDISELGETRKGFFMECYLMRLSEILAPAYLYLKDLKKARRYADILFNSNICAKTNSDAYYYMGLSFMLEDEDSCLRFLRSSLTEAFKSGDASIIREAENTLQMFEGFFTYKSKGTIPTGLPNAEDMLLKDMNPVIRYFGLVGEGSIEELISAYRVYTQEFNFLFQSIVIEDLVNAGLDPIFANPIKDTQLTYKGDVYFEKDFVRSFTFWCTNRSIDDATEGLS